MVLERPTRRDFLLDGVVAGASLALAGCEGFPRLSEEMPAELADEMQA
jgi:hypothetical protein